MSEKNIIEFAKELDKASIVMVGGRFIDGERERILRFFRPKDIGVDIKVNHVGMDVELNQEIFNSNKEILELKFHHTQSIDGLIHRLEELKTLGCEEQPSLEADDLFKELGYEVENNDEICRIYKTTRCSTKIICVFFKKATDRRFRLKIYEKYLTIEELMAINKKCKELRWI